MVCVCGVSRFAGFCSGFCSVVLVHRLPLDPPPLVPIPLVGLSAPSCPHLCPRYLGHRCGHVVVDKPAEIRPRRGRRHRNWMYPRGVCRPRWPRASAHIATSNCHIMHVEVQMGLAVSLMAYSPMFLFNLAITSRECSSPSNPPPSIDPRPTLVALLVLLGFATIDIRPNSPCDT